MLSPASVQRFYDRFGARQDSQAFYEDRALDALLANSALADAHTILEFGCGSGRFAKRILTLFPEALYEGFDVSTTMVGLARRSLTGFGDRAVVHQLEPGTVELPVRDQSTDRVISTYVLDLLPIPDIKIFFEEARRVLTPQGRLSLVSLTNGGGALTRVISRLWHLVFRLNPHLVGGCRPIELGQFCEQARWDIVHHATAVRWAISSEVLVARPHAA